MTIKRGTIWRPAIGLGIFVLIAIGLESVIPAPVAAQRSSCQKIRTACRDAGFVIGGAPGNRLVLDCFKPIVDGAPPPRSTSRPLPAVDPQWVNECRLDNGGTAQPEDNPGTSAPASEEHATTQPNVPSAPNENTSLAPSGDGQIIHDRSLRITWLADANLAAKQSFGIPNINKSGSMDYETALQWVAAMNAYDQGRGYLGHNNWTLPATPSYDGSCASYNRQGGGSFGYGCLKSAMASLYYRTLGLRSPDTAVLARNSQAGPFRNFQPYLYWTDTPAANTNQGIVTFSFNTGWQGANIPKHNCYVLPMIEGNPFHAATDNEKGLQVTSDGRAVYDPVGDVTWPADADLAMTEKFGVADINSDGSMRYETAVQWIAAMNKAHWLGQTSWRLPPSARCGGFHCKASALGALFYDRLGLRQGDPVIAIPDTPLGDFHNIQPYLYWSCAGEAVRGPCQGVPAPRFGWSFSFGNGFQGTDLQTNNLYVMVYFPDSAR